jgi:predicted metal-binding protein
MTVHPDRPISPGSGRQPSKLQPRGLIEKAAALGAVEAKIIPPSSVVTAEWVRMKCRYGCDGYGSSWCCPPRSPEPEQTRKVLDCYTTALLVHFGSDVRVTRAMVKLEKEAFLAGWYKAFALGAGPCSLCKECDLAQCRNEDARPSMEACGIDVFATARANGYPIEVLADRSNPENCYGLLLIE